MERLKETLWGLGGLLIIGASLAALALLLSFGADIGLTIIPYLQLATGYAFAIDLLIALPMLLFKRFRPVAARILLFSSYIFGLFTWVAGFLVTYAFWGTLGLLVGLGLAGVGVVPTALLATLINGRWPVFTNIVFSAALTFGARFLAIFIDYRATEAASGLRGCGMFNFRKKLRGDAMLDAVKNRVDLDLTAYIGSVREEGATDKDIREWWNMPDKQHQEIIEDNDLARLAVLKGLIDDGLTENAAIEQIKKTFPLYEFYEPGIIYLSVDSSLPYELLPRVNKYFNSIAVAEQCRDAINELSSMNAFIREQIKKGLL